MQNSYEAQWISRAQAAKLRRSGGLGRAILMDTSSGLIVVQPAGSELGDGARLSMEEANYELQAVWYPGPVSRLREVRKLLGLEAEEHVGVGR